MSSIFVEMSGDERKLWRSMQKIIQKEKETAEGMKKIGEEAARTETKVERLSRATDKQTGATKGTKQALTETASAGNAAFGGAALASVTKFAAGVVSVSVAIGAVTAAFRKAKEERERALQSVKELADSDRSLNQIASSPEQLAAWQKQADDAAMKYGYDPNLARQVLFNAESGAFAEHFDDFIRGKNVVDPLAASSMALELRDLFSGQKLKPMEGINMALVAARNSKLNMERIASALPIAAEGAGPAGSTPEELFAMAGPMANLFSGEAFAPRLRAFAARVAQDPELKGKGIMNALSALQQMDDGSRAKWIGQSAEVNAAYDRLVQLAPEIQSNMLQMEEVRRSVGTAASPVEQGILRAWRNPDFVARDVEGQGQVGRDVAQRQAYASDEALASAVQNRIRERMDRDKVNPVSRATANLLMGGTSIFTNNPDTLNNAGVIGANFYSGANFRFRDNDDWIAAQREAAAAAREFAAGVKEAKQAMQSPKTAAQRAELGRHREN